MSERTHLSVRPETHEALAAHKRESESWDDCLQRLAAGDAGTLVVVEKPSGTETRDVADGPVDIVADGPVAVRVETEFD